MRKGEIWIIKENGIEVKITQITSNKKVKLWWKNLGEEKRQKFDGDIERQLANSIYGNEDIVKYSFFQEDGRIGCCTRDRFIEDFEKKYK